MDGWIVNIMQIGETAFYIFTCIFLSFANHLTSSMHIHPSDWVKTIGKTWSLHKFGMSGVHKRGGRKSFQITSAYPFCQLHPFWYFNNLLDSNKGARRRRNETTYVPRPSVSSLESCPLCFFIQYRSLSMLHARLSSAFMFKTTFCRRQNSKVRAVEIVGCVRALPEWETCLVEFAV